MTHAVLVGISCYEHYRSLGAGAHTAVRIFNWLNEADARNRLMAPLATVTLLLSPSDNEQEVVEREIGDGNWTVATRENIVEALNRLHDIVDETEIGLLRPHENVGAGMGIYYFGGHGVDVFRDDPVGLATEAYPTDELWHGAFDHLEFRERLTHILDARPKEKSRRCRYLFLYDCCRSRDHGNNPASVKHEYPDLTSSKDIRPHCVLSAASEGFPAWEPAEPINLPPTYPLPLSFFGHAFVNVATWAEDASVDETFPWETSSAALDQNLNRTINELAKKDASGQPLDGGQPVKGLNLGFPVYRSDRPPEVHVSLSCDPETSWANKKVIVSSRRRNQGEDGFEEQKRLPPWNVHPDSQYYSPGIFRIDAEAGVNALKPQIIKLRPSVSPWRWIIRDDEIAIHDPSK